MFRAVTRYFSELATHFGQGWTRFWFTPTDPATLSVLRILTALVALTWYLSYLPDLERFFGPDGWLSLPAVQQWRGPLRVFSVFDYATTSASLAFLYGLGVVALVAMAVGLASRVATVVSFVWVVSLVWRAPMLAGPIDDVLPMLMFYLCLGPSGAACSIDAWWRRRRAAKPATQRTASAASAWAQQAAAAPQRSSAANVALRLIQVHLVLIYVSMTLAQLKGQAWWVGMALWNLIALPDSPLVDLTFLHDYPVLVNFWTHAVTAIEIAFVVLVWNRWTRPLVLTLAALMWFSLALVTGMVLFAIAMIVAGLAFVPGGAMRACLTSCRLAENQAAASEKATRAREQPDTA
jgi:hypothetical protein